MKQFLTAVTLLSIPNLAAAHEGHGAIGEGNTLKHYAFEPIHLPLLLFACAAFLWIVAHLRSRRVHSYRLRSE